MKTGRYLREKPEDAWAIPFIDAVIEADKKAVIEASRPRITINLSDLEQIRRDAATTRESLLTEDLKVRHWSMNLKNGPKKLHRLKI